MKNKLVSRCCGSEVKKRVIGNICVKCGRICEVIEEPIQKEEVMRSGFELDNGCQGFKNANTHSPTPSDTFIEKNSGFSEIELGELKKYDNFIESKMKEFDEKFPELSVIHGIGISGDVRGYDATPLVKQFLKSSLQSQRQSILEEIEKMKVSEISASEGNNELRGRISENLNSRFTNGACIEWAMAELYNQALEDIKQII